MSSLGFWQGGAQRSFVVRARSSAVAALTMLAASCTFYTGKPDPPAPSGNGNQSAGGSNPGTGASGQGSGAEGMQAGAGGGGGEEPTPWKDATSTLIDRTSATGGVVLLAAQPNADVLIAGVAGLGLWASSDGGQEWVGLGQTGESALISHWVTSIVFDPDDANVFWETGIYVGGGVFKSSDGGVTTQQLGTGMVTHNDLVAIDFTDPERKTLLAGGHEQDNMVWLSRDSGETWENIGETLPESCGFSSNPMLIDDQTFLVGCVTQIARTTDGGASWDVVSNAGGFGPPLVASDGAIYWRIDAGFGLMRSDDDGSSWVRVTGPGVVQGPVFELPDQRLVSMTETRIIVSDDRGDSWAELGTEFPTRVGGFVYSAQQRAFFVWTGSEGSQIPADSILRFDWDYESE